jgi:hypothetical protein
MVIIAALRRAPRIRLGALFLAALIVVAIGLSGVGGIFFPDSITPTRAVLAGTWTHDRGAVLVLRPDGTFAGEHLPSRFGDWSIGEIPATGTGTWHIGRFSADVENGLVLDFAGPHAGTVTELLVEHCCGSPMAVYYDKGDPDVGGSGQYQLVKRQPAAAMPEVSYRA